jgi:inner membrane protein
MLGFAPLELIVIAGVATLAGAGTPDLDTKTSLVKHRGFTHTIWFSLLYGVAVAGFTFVSPDVFGFSNFQSFSVGQAILAGCFGAFGVLTHLAGDVITPRGIKPFDPVTPREVLPVQVSDKKYCYEMTKADDKTANSIALGIGSLAIAVAASAGAYVFL